ncbi:MAG: peptidase S46 [Bacteroidia bacterium]|nr:MAG: peptidase S46 [Bacteroidia bacterium]
MKKEHILSALLVFSFLTSKSYNPPDEGMWLPMLIGKNFKEMKKMGLKLTPDDIYNVNKSSLKDAIVWLQFCTGTFISNEGLMLTNHHCAYSSIQYHSTVQNDYLTNGFWAMKKSEEKHCPEITASVLYRMEDVTEKVKNAGEKKQEVIKEIEKTASENGRYMAQVKDMFNGGEYYLFVYEVFKDVRLVGAPPSAIGKFGGDTDNWVWPRHTGDFSLFRVYASPDNQPAEYSEKNVPYKPKHFLPINIKGIKPNDFTMVFGFPGRTERYQTASQIQLAMDYSNPTLVLIMAKRLETMKKEMDAKHQVRIQLADKYASLSNSWKYYLGQNEGLKRLDLVNYKKSEEEKFLRWANADATRKEYANTIPNIDNAVKEYQQYIKPVLYFNVGILGVGANSLGLTVARMYQTMKSQPDDKNALTPFLNELKNKSESHFKDYDAYTDQRLLVEMLLLYYQNVDKNYHPDVIKTIVSDPSNPGPSIEAFAKSAFESSFLVSETKLKNFLENPSLEAIEKDPIADLVIQFFNYYQKNLMSKAQAYNSVVSSNRGKYIEGLRKMYPEKLFYPDANMTPRITYGKVIDYEPFDGAKYYYYTTTKGILEKYKPGDEEFDVPKKLIDLIKKKDFGRYGKNGELMVSFITDNDITGGNSGSSVINGEGHVIGLAYDGNWEAMTGDLVFDKQYKRCISNNIGYVLFIIDKFAGATHLIQEMKIIE